MPYRSRPGGVFGSGLYQGGEANGNAGEIVDALTRGASTLIQGAYLRAQAARKNAIEDAQLKLQQRAADRADEHDQWERSTHEADVRFRQGQLDRQDAVSGYAPATTTETQEVVPGSVTSNGLFGAPPTATAPTIKSAYQTKPAAYDVTKSQPYQIEALKEKDRQATRAENVLDREKVHAANRNYDRTHPLPHGSAGGDSPAVHAATQIARQLNEADQQIKALNAERVKVAPATYQKDGKTVSVGGNPDRVAAIDTELSTLKQRGDSLRTIHGRVAGKLTDEAGISREIPPSAGTGVTTAPAPTTIKGAYGGKAQKPDGGTVRNGPSKDAIKPTGETIRSGPAKDASKPNGSTVRLGQKKKETISQAEADSLASRGFDRKNIANRYNISR